MGFWQNVENECEYLGISRKELSEKANFSVHTISNGIKRDGMPAADLALRISRALNVPLEKLLDVTPKDTESFIGESEKQKRVKKLFSKYLNLVEKLDGLPDESKKAVITVIEKLR